MPTVIIPPTDVSPYTGTGDQVLATNPVFPSNITVSGTTDSSSKDTGAIVTEGGLGVEKSASIGGNLTVSGTGGFGGNVTITKSSGAAILKSNTSDTASYASFDSQITGGNLTGYRFGSTYSSSGQYQAGSALIEVTGSNADLWLTTSRYIKLGNNSNGGNTTTFDVTNGNATLSGNLTVSGRDLTLGSSESVIYFGTPSANYLYYNGSSLFLRVGSVDRITIPASTGNVLIGTTTDFGGRLTVNKSSQSASSSTPSGAVVIGDTGTTGALELGVNSSAYLAYIQSRDRTGASFYKLNLNPAGGNVLIGTTTDGGQKLQVSGTIASSTATPENGQLQLNVGRQTLNDTWGIQLGNTYAPIARILGRTDSAGNGTGSLLFYTGTGGGTPAIALTLDSSQNATFAGTVTTTGLITVTGTTASIANGATADITLNTPSSLVGYYVRSEGNSNDQSSGFYRSNNNGASSAFVLFGQSEANVAVTTPAAGTIRITNNTGGTIAFAYAFTVLVKR